MDIKDKSQWDDCDIGGACCCYGYTSGQSEWVWKADEPHTFCRTLEFGASTAPEFDQRQIDFLGMEPCDNDDIDAVDMIDFLKEHFNMQKVK